MSSYFENNNLIQDKNKTQINLLIIGTTISYLFMVIMNFLANYLPFNGITSEEISNRYYNIFTPAGFTFLIWLVIYVLLGILVFTWIRGVLKDEDIALRSVSSCGGLFIFSSILNGVWLLAWHFDYISLSLIIMLALLVSLILLYLKLKSIQDGWHIVPVSIYLGWITVATIANVVVFSVARDWGQFGLADEFWLALLLIITTLITAIFVFKKNDIAYGLVIVWAMLGIFVERYNTMGWSTAAILTMIALLIVSGIVVQKIRIEL